MRMTTHILTIAALASVAGADGTGVWLWDVTTDNGDTIVEPGEQATVTLSMAMVPDESVVLGISATIFDTLGGPNADNGHIVGWKVLNSLADLTGDLTTTDGVSLYGTQAGQIMGFGPFTGDNPVDVLEFTWEPDVHDAYTVTYFTSTEILVVWEDTGTGGTAVQWPDIAEAKVTFSVIPAPALSLGLPLVALLTRRRR